MLYIIVHDEVPQARRKRTGEGSISGGGGGDCGDGKEEEVGSEKNGNFP